MRQACLALACILLLAVQFRCRAGEVIEQVPPNSVAYTQLDVLMKAGLLSASQDNQLNNAKNHQLTRYDFGCLLVEPLRRFTALVQAKDAPSTDLVQRQRIELTYQAVTHLPSGMTFDQLLVATSQLLTSYSDVVEQISPGLHQQADEALKKLKQKEYRPWIIQPIVIRTSAPAVKVSVNPHAQPDTMHDPLPMIPGTATSSDPKFMIAGTGGSSVKPFILGSKPVTTQEFTVDVAFHRFRLYGTVGTLPGDQVSDLISLSPNAKTMVGFQYPIATLSALGISGFVELRTVRTGDPGSIKLTNATGGGFILNW